MIAAVGSTDKEKNETTKRLAAKICSLLEVVADRADVVKVEKAATGKRKQC